MNSPDTYRNVPILFPLSLLSKEEVGAVKLYIDALWDRYVVGFPDRLCIEREPGIDYSLAYVVAAVSFMDFANTQSKQKLGPVIIACSSKRDISVVTKSIKRFLEHRQDISLEEGASRTAGQAHGGFVVSDMLDMCINPTSIKLSKYNTCLQAYNEEGIVADMEECAYYTEFARNCKHIEIDITNGFYSTADMKRECRGAGICPYYCLRYLLDKGYMTNSPDVQVADILVCSDEYLKSSTKSYELFEYLGFNNDYGDSDNDDGDTLSERLRQIKAEEQQTIKIKEERVSPDEGGPEIKSESATRFEDGGEGGLMAANNQRGCNRRKPYMSGRQPLIVFYSYRNTRLYESFVTRNDMDGTVRELNQIKTLIGCFDFKQKEVIEESDEEDRVIEKTFNNLLEVDTRTVLTEKMIRYSKNIKSIAHKTPKGLGATLFYRAGPRLDTPIYFINLILRNARLKLRGTTMASLVASGSTSPTKKSVGEAGESNETSSSRLYPPLGFIPGAIVDMYSFIDFLRTVIEVIKSKMKICNNCKIVPDKPITSKLTHERTTGSNNNNNNNNNSNNTNGGADGNTTAPVSNNNTTNANYYFGSLSAQGKDHPQKHYEDGVTTAEFVESLIDDINSLCTENNIVFPYLTQRTMISPAGGGASPGGTGNANTQNNPGDFSAPKQGTFVHQMFSQGRTSQTQHLNFLSISRALASVPYRLNVFFAKLFQYLRRVGGRHKRDIVSLVDFRFIFNLAEFVGTLGLAGMASYYAYRKRIKMSITRPTHTGFGGGEDIMGMDNGSIMNPTGMDVIVGKEGDDKSELHMYQNTEAPPSFILLYSYPPYIIQNKTVKEPKLLGKQTIRIVFNEVRNNLKASLGNNDLSLVRKYATLTNAPILSVFELLLLGGYHILFESYTLEMFMEVYGNSRYRTASLPVNEATTANNSPPDTKREPLGTGHLVEFGRLKDEVVKEEREPTETDDYNGDDGGEGTKAERGGKPTEHFEIIIVDHGSDQTMITLHPAQLSSQLYTSQESSIFKNLGLLILTMSKFVSSGIVVALPSSNVLSHAVQMWADMGLFDTLTPCLFIRNPQYSTVEEKNMVIKGFTNAVLLGRGGVLITTTDDNIDIPRITTVEPHTQASVRPHSNNEIDIVGALIIMGIPYSSRLPAHTAMYLSTMRWRNIMYSTPGSGDIGKAAFQALDLLISESADTVALMAGNILHTNPRCKVVLADCRFLNSDNNKSCVTRRLPRWMRDRISNEKKGVSNESVYRAFKIDCK